jgi:hypothetical protein
VSDTVQGEMNAPETPPVAVDPVPDSVDAPDSGLPSDVEPAVDPVESAPVETAPAPVVEDPVEIDPVAAALEAPGHAVGDVIEGAERGHTVGFFPCGVDKLGRVWRIEEGDDGDRLVLAGRLQT